MFERCSEPGDVPPSRPGITPDRVRSALNIRAAQAYYREFND